MPDPSQYERFSDLLRQNYRQLYGFIYSHVRDFSDTEELLQDVSLVLWQKFADFDPQTNFATWACQIAKFMILNFLRKKGRQQARFTEAFQSHLLSVACEDVTPPDDIRHEALEHCVGGLPSEQSEMLWEYYGGTKTVEQIASEQSRAPSGIYGSLHYIRRKLLECMKRYIDRGAQA